MSNWFYIFDSDWDILNVWFFSHNASIGFGPADPVERGLPDAVPADQRQEEPRQPCWSLGVCRGRGKGLHSVLGERFIYWLVMNISINLFALFLAGFQMMHNLLLEEGDIVQLKSLSLPVATFSKFQPQNPDFLDITNPKAVLENALRNFACLTSGDLIAIKYNSKIYELCVLETKPGDAVSIIECDMNVNEFRTINGFANF